MTKGCTKSQTTQAAEMRSKLNEAERHAISTLEEVIAHLICAGLTMHEIALLAQISCDTLTRWRKGIGAISATVLYRLREEAFGAYSWRAA